MLSWYVDHPGAELGGVFSGDGTDMMHATVYTNPVGQPPPELHGLVTPVHDPAGAVCDWRLAPVRSSITVTPDDIARYRQWRSQYARELFLGERALVTTFLSWAGSRYNVSELLFLHSHTAYIDNAHAYKLRRQIDDLTGALSRSDDTGLGLVMPPTHRAAGRALIPTIPPTTVLSTRGVTITASPAGLMLNAYGPDEAVHHTALHGWRLQRPGLIVSTDTGEEKIPDSPAAGLIGALGRDSDEVAVRPTKMSALLAPTLMFLRDAADLAVSGHTGLSTRTGAL